MKKIYYFLSSNLLLTYGCNKVKTAIKQFRVKEEQLKAYKTVEKWLAGIRNKTTRKNYINWLYLYCTDTQMTPDQLVEEKARSLQNPSLQGLAEDRLIQWYWKASPKRPGVAINVFKTVRSFFKANYVPLSAKIPTYVQQREEIYIPTKPEVRAMCELANLEVKTLILFLSESGRRIGTLCDMRYRHVKESLENWEPSKPFCFSIPQKRNKYGKLVKSKRIYGMWGFVCGDAVKSLKLLIRINGITQDEDLLFPYESQSYSKVISDLGTKIGINEEEGNGLRKFRAHNLRKMAQTIMEDTGIPLNWVDRILGHKPRGAQGATYSLPPKEKLAAKYKLAMDALRIYGAEKTTNSELEELRQRISQLEAIVAKLT